MEQISLFDSMLAGAVRQVARYLCPRTICVIINDCERTTIAPIREVASTLRDYMSTVWPNYEFTPLPADPYFTVAGRFQRTYGKDEYGAEYLRNNAHRP